ncbi:hypothetical protein CONLIGDRAFT_325064 [Coniochaeta ligniaria NRRL 30616]|uniref:Uncharacterized protein n=1 Tax=Coniochaeta ligniaria NRRL 30616 TaxID=1408157 RepID=A0A1J7J801_9PEZI|nr:hypothetical protein CONLIGDRAFT_325064 [Coniochaeta ligniaria NRRL 30616]
MDTANLSQPIYHHRRFGHSHPHPHLTYRGPGGKKMAILKMALIGTGVWLIAKKFMHPGDHYHHHRHACPDCAGPTTVRTGQLSKGSSWPGPPGVAHRYPYRPASYNDFDAQYGSKHVVREADNN